MTGVTLQGQFTAERNLGGVLIVHDGLAVTGLDGSDGVLDLATTPTSLRVDAPTVAGAATLIDHVTIRTGKLSEGVDGNIINAQAALTLGSATVVNMSATSAIGGNVVNAGTINVADAGADVRTSWAWLHPLTQPFSERPQPSQVRSKIAELSTSE